MKFIKKESLSEFRREDGILRHNISLETTLKVTEFYKSAPFPNFQGFENKFQLAETVNKNIFLNDLKKTIGLNKKFIEVGSGTSQLSLAMAIGTNNLVVALDPAFESLRLGKNFAELRRYIEQQKRIIVYYEEAVSRKEDEEVR